VVGKANRQKAGNKMKRLRLIAFAVVSLLVPILPVARHHAMAKATAKPRTASARYAQINRDIGRCRIVNIKFKGAGYRGGTARAYLWHGSPQKLVAHTDGQWGYAVEEYYFWDHSLFFVVRATFSYDESSGAVVSKAKRTGEDRFYFRNGKLVRWQQDRKLMALSDANAKNYEAYEIETVRDYLQQVRQKTHR
jgi:hypothetical protein